MVDQISPVNSGLNMSWSLPSRLLECLNLSRWTLATHRSSALIFTVIWYVIGLRWIWLYRRENLFDFDEAGYLAIAALTARSHGFVGWIRSACLTAYAPATLVVAAVIFSLFGIHLVLGFLVPLTAALATLLLIFGMGLRIGGPRTAWAALILLASMPVFVDYSRDFHFAMGSTLATVAALYCLLRSDGMASLAWAMLFGLCVGLMPLTRTMVIAYVPAVLLAALISACGHENSRQRLFRLAYATLLAAVTTALWLIPNWQGVFGYLLDFGYGGHSSSYGTRDASLLHLGTWLGTLRYYYEDAQLIHSSILLIGVTVTFIVAVRRSLARDAMAVAWNVAHSPLLGPAVLFVVGTIALVSTPNHGTAFDLPLLSALVLVSAWGLAQARKYLWRGIIVVLIIATMIVYIPDIDLRSPLAKLRTIEVPMIGRSVLIDGRGSLQQYEEGGLAVAQLGPAFPSRESWLAHELAAPTPEPIDSATTRDWRRIISQTVEFIRQENQVLSPVAFGFRHILYNSSSVGLAQFSKYDYGDKLVWGRLIDPTLPGNPEDVYFSWLADGDAVASCLLLTSAGAIDEVAPIPDSDALISAARRAKFVSFSQWTLPDGREVVAWRRDTGSCRKK